jgi:arylsulfatase A-like enzyme
MWDSLMQFSSILGSNQLKYFLYMLLVAALLAWIGGLKDLTKSILDVAQKERVPVRPNILLIVVDDLGYNDISTINPTGIPTPNIDSLASNGVIFTRHYADSTCAPSRVAILTGRYPERSGFRPRGIEIPSEYPTLAERLSLQGYSTYMVGKWHAGEERKQGWPDNKGFDGWYGFLNQWQLKGNDKQKQMPTYYEPWVRQDGGEMIQVNGHLTDILTSHSVSKIRELNKIDKPWFLYHAFLAPHYPIQPAQRYAKQHLATPEGKYQALIHQLDDSIGKLIAEIDSNTLVVFLSDNGGTNESRNNNFPFFGKKDEVYEGSYRTPLIIKLIEPISEQSIDEVVMNVDILPTIMGAVGTPVVDNVDGRNLWPRLTRGQNLPVIARSWEQTNWNIEALTYSYLSKDGRWRLSRRYGLNLSLSDLSADPSGEGNVAATYHEVVESLDQKFWLSHLEKSKLPVNEKVNVIEESIEYSGFDVMRVPYLYGFAIGMQIGPWPDFDELTPATLASQENVWKLLYVPNKGVEWHIGNTILATSDFDKTSCNSYILTGDMQPSEDYFSDLGEHRGVKLYSHGLIKAQDNKLSFNQPLDSEMALPTKVFYGGKAIFLNTALSSYFDSYSPKIPIEHYDMFNRLHKERKLGISKVHLLENELCVN